ncbi:geranyltranstransferase [Campylobacter hyointestinalis subsp. hyointestinalis]|uniref:Geranyltranstransferase n=1 Tax=Campylobacter hyointestinalis subsp. hyointestinalis TaxID=91352 RepID=A0A9W5AL43_CAMHY|nr:polyprenyl synthetase family protein [Campylobacter hyointestinalis]CUU68094.1 geranyltranstransferase [Campylobacter hyointestinalis subsp. hyointestinalis]
MSFDEYLNLNLPRVESFHPHFNDALTWVLKAGGKHFRAKLLLGVVEAIKPDMLQNAYPVAFGVELFHTYSLVHDDLPAMDNAPLRRGVETLHVKYDEVTAILVGDALNTHAFYVISNADLAPEIIVKCTQILSKNGGIYGMAIGQACDCFFERKRLALDELKFLHIHKTGALIAASMQIGAVIAGLDKLKCDEIYKIGIKLGLAFQIHDDIIDATSKQADAGKPTSNDVFKNSFTNLLGISQAKKQRDELEEQILDELKDSPIKNLVTNLINKYLKG